MHKHLHLLHFCQHFIFLVHIYAFYFFFTLPVSLVGFQVATHLLWAPTLLLKQSNSALIGWVFLQCFGSMSACICVDPLQKKYVVLKFILPYFLDRAAVIYLEFSDGLLDDPHVSDIFFGDFCSQIQSRDRDASGVNGINDLSVGDSITQHFYSLVLSLEGSIDPEKQVVPPEAHYYSLKYIVRRYSDEQIIIPVAWLFVSRLYLLRIGQGGI